MAEQGIAAARRITDRAIDAGITPDQLRRKALECFCTVAHPKNAPFARDRVATVAQRLITGAWPDGRIRPLGELKAEDTWQAKRDRERALWRLRGQMWNRVNAMRREGCADDCEIARRLIAEGWPRAMVESELCLVLEVA